jgi:hypothetical protein
VARSWQPAPGAALQLLSEVSSQQQQLAKPGSTASTQDATDPRLQNLFLVLFYHLSFRENVAVVEAAWRALRGREGSETAAGAPAGGGQASGVLLRLLKLTAASLFSCRLEAGAELGRGAYATIVGAAQRLPDGGSRWARPRPPAGCALRRGCQLPALV